MAIKLIRNILEQNILLTVDCQKVKEVKAAIARKNEDDMTKLKNDTLDQMAPAKDRPIKLANEKGASSWLSTLPIEEWGFLC